MTDTGAMQRSSRRRIGRVALGAAVYIYLLIVFGAFVRISGSGLGCGDDWPNCNGKWLPAWDVTTWIEWGHRLLAAGAAVPILAVAALAFISRRHEDPHPPRLLRPAVLVLGLLLVQAALGAITVKLELPPPVTIAHFIVASLILGLLLLIAVRGLHDAPAAGRLRWSPPLAAAALALAVIAWGAWTANADASMACLGFPLCNGDVFPMGGNPAHTRAIHIHWMHRVMAYALVLLVAYAMLVTWRRGLPRSVRRAAVAALILVALQAAVGAGLVTLTLPATLRALHVAVGMALWSALVVWAALWRRAMLQHPVKPRPASDMAAAGFPGAQ